MEPICAAENLPDFTGEVLLGRYRATKLLGAGAAGAVYLALDLDAPTTSSGAPVECAVKVVKKAGPSNSQTRQQRREITLHQLVSDIPNVLALHATAEDETYFYLVMDYHESDTFQVLCYDEQPYIGKDELVRSVFVQILDAVHACHERRVFHRDLKPENILCNADGSEVYIADFGLGTQKLFSYTFGCGTSTYLSPECLAEECEPFAYSTRHGDIWALGVILVNMTTGLNPWDKAVTADEAFSEFLVDDDHFERVLPVSKGMIRILKRIFSIDPLARPSIPELRKSILELPTFFRPESDVACPVHPTPKVGSIDAAGEGPEGTVEEGEAEQGEDIGTVDLFAYGLDDGYLPSFVASTSTSSSSSESRGPATPGESVQPRVGVSEFVEDLEVALRPLAEKTGKLVAEDASPALNVLERLEMLVLE